MRAWWIIGLALLTASCASAPVAEAPAGPVLSVQEILDQSPAGDWRPLDPQNTLYMDLPDGRVIIELAPHFCAQPRGQYPRARPRAILTTAPSCARRIITWCNGAAPKMTRRRWARRMKRWPRRSPSPRAALNHAAARSRYVCAACRLQPRLSRRARGRGGLACPLLRHGGLGPGRGARQRQWRLALRGERADAAQSGSQHHAGGAGGAGHGDSSVMPRGGARLVFTKRRPNAPPSCARVSPPICPRLSGSISKRCAQIASLGRRWWTPAERGAMHFSRPIQ